MPHRWLSATVPLPGPWAAPPRSGRLSTVAGGRAGFEDRMCLAVPMMVREVREGMALVESGGMTVEVDTILVGEVVEGDHLVVHAGCAIEKLDEEAAQEALEQIARLAALEE